MAGRPRKSLALVAQDGDTRKLGARKHAERLKAGVHVRVEMPALPKALDADRGAPEWQRKMLAIARAHWRHLAEELIRNGLIGRIDEGMLTTAALAYAGMVMAAKSGGAKGLAELTQRYMQASDRLGTNPSARAKFVRDAGKGGNEIEDDLCA